ncbi:MAG: NusG domain II-containing protein [Thermodesulfobacteriota bacterium]|nr:NusG domain II-containing protein [Thermodesulfobacteriota bacterium]
MKAIGWVTRLTPFDRKLLVVVAILVALSFLLLLRQTTGARVVVSSDDRIVFVAPLNKDRRVELDGPLGITVLQIENGAARIISSPCVQKICIGMGEARHTGDLIACVPNQLVISIEGENEGEEYDFISR